MTTAWPGARADATVPPSWEVQMHAAQVEADEDDAMPVVALIVILVVASLLGTVLSLLLS